MGVEAPRGLRQRHRMLGAASIVHRLIVTQYRPWMAGSWTGVFTVSSLSSEPRYLLP